MDTESIEYQADGARRVGYLAVDRARSGKRPGVLIAHEASGVSDIVKQRARRLAGMGYVAFALDYVGDGVVLQDRNESGALVARLAEAPDRIRAIARESLEVLRKQPEVGANKIAGVGYCFGGTAMLELARSGADMACTVGFHSVLATKRPDDAHQIKGKVLVCIGAEDPLVPPEQRLAFEREMRAGKVDWRLYLFGNAVHGFANPDADRFNHPALAYHRPTDERSFRAMVDLFDETFGPI
jgi:dienelactone hydrolase